MNNKATLNEIDRLEGIAQAYKRGRAARRGVGARGTGVVAVGGVIEDCTLARDMVAQIVDLEADLECYNERITEIQEDRDEAKRDLNGANIDLGILMTSLSARLEW